MMINQERLALFYDSRYPRASRYDAQWLYDNRMGDPCLWNLESLSHDMDLQPGMRVLDLGCGKAVTSIFLAREFGVTVFAADLWIPPSENWQRIRAAGVEDRVFPIHADAHRLPFAASFFDAIIAVNSLQFFATANTYLSDHLAHLLRPEGQFGAALFGPDQEFNGPVPEEMRSWWWPDFYYFHSLAWWRWHFEQTGLFSVETADDMEGDGVRIARVWAKIMENTDRLDKSGIMRWNRLVAKRNQYQADDFRIGFEITPTD